MDDARHIVILGGGFGGVLTARRLSRLFRKRPDMRITLVSRDNFLLMTPLMFEACTGTLELRHCSVAIRALVPRTRFVEGIVHGIDLERRSIQVGAGYDGAGGSREINYSQLVLALGAMTNTHQIPGSEHALTFKTLADVIVLRNHILECLERADVEENPAARRRRLAIAVIGGGFVGSELFGEMTAFIDEVLKYYPRIDRAEFRLSLVQAGPRIMPEIPEKLADYAVRILRARAGVEILVNESVEAIEPGAVRLKDRTIEAETIILSAGILPSPIVAGLPIARDERGHVRVEPTMRCTDRPEIWAIGDCACIPDPDGKPYPKLAQMAMRQVKVLADNIHAAVDGGAIRPFEFKTLGLLAAIGHEKGLGTVMGFRVRGFFAWWLRRTYYLKVMPRWSQRIRIVADWTIALFFRPEISKVDLGREQVARMRAMNNPAPPAPKAG